MSIRKAYGFPALLTIYLIYGIFSLILGVMTILFFGYGFWPFAVSCLLLFVVILSFLIFITGKIYPVFKPFKNKNGQIVEVKVTQIKLRGWMFAYNVEFEGIEDDRKIQGVLLATWTSEKLGAGQFVKCYKINDKYLMLKP